MSRNYLILTVAIVLCAGNVSPATTYTGSLSVENGGLDATGTWGDPVTSIAWKVDYLSAQELWRYEYTLTVKDPGGISHVIFEVSPVVLLNEFSNFQGFPTGWFVEEKEVKTYTSGGSNPEMPGNLYGIKFETKQGFDDLLTSTVSFDIGRVPVWGDFYAKDGKHDNYWTTVCNSGFLLDDPTSDPQDGSIDYHILRPDTKTSEGGPPIPEPVLGTVMSIIAGAGLVLRRMRRKVN